MNCGKFLVRLLLASTGVELFGSTETDRKLERAAKASQNDRTVLEDHVKNGDVTRTGIAKSLVLKLAQDICGVNRRSQT